MVVSVAAEGVYETRNPDTHRQRGLSVFALGAIIASGVGTAATHRHTAAATADVGPSTGTLHVDVSNQNGDPVSNQTVVITDVITGDQVFNGTTDNAGQIATNLPEGSYYIDVDGDTQLATVVGGTTTTATVNLNTNVEQPGPLQGPPSAVVLLLCESVT